VEGKRIVLRLGLYEEQAARDGYRGELGSSNLKQSFFPGKVCVRGSWRRSGAMRKEEGTSLNNDMRREREW
jgi:hypothetical protein